MVTLEQVKLLETKVTKAVEYVERVSRENVQLQGKLDSYQKRIDELEVLIRKFKEDQGRIEDGILSALDRLNKFEDAIEKSIAPAASRVKKPARANEDSPPQLSAELISEPPELPTEPLAEPPEEVPLDLTPEGVESPPPSPVPFVRPVLLAELLPDEILPDISIEGTGSGESKESPAAGELDIF